MNMLQPFQPGDTIHGFCNGYFGRDDYETKVCVFVRPKYAVFEYEDGRATVLNFEERLTEVAAKWKTP
jgi:hypothetical protein